MTYGIEIRNSDNVVVIDGTYPNYALHNTSTIVVNAGDDVEYSSPGTYQGADLVLASPPAGVSAWVGYEHVYLSQAYVRYYAPSGSYDLFTATTGRLEYIRNYGQFTAATGHGMNVWDASSNLVFSTSNLNRHFEVVATGVVSGTTVVRDSVAWPSTTTTVPNLDKYFVAIASTYVGYDGFSTYYHRGFEYQYTSGTTGRIWIQNFITTTSGNIPCGGNPLNYLICRIRP